MMRVAMKLRLDGRNHETTLSIMIKDQLRCPSTHALRRLIIIYRATALEMGGLILNTGAGFKFVISCSVFWEKDWVWIIVNHF